MADLSSIIRYYRYKYERDCSFYKGNDECSRIETGCYCKKLAEVSGHIYRVIPQEYRNFNVNNVSGTIKTRDGNEVEVWSPANKVAIFESLNDYLYGRKDTLELSSREDFNKASKLDKRFAEGANLIIHGKPYRQTKTGATVRSVPLGKTLLACIVLTDAIWRRYYATNKADTYALISYQNLKQDLKQKNEKSYDLRECDWLVIDDVSIPQNESDFNHQNFIALFDDFLMSRMEQKLPTILACDFNVEARDYTDSLGYSFQKMVTAMNSWLIKVGD